jgi:hypothetical protein
MQADAQLWGDLLHVTGGALEIKKCNYYIMKWNFKPSGIPELDSTVQTILHLENGDRTGSVTLTNDAITVAHKTLGTWKSAKRDQKKQIDVLTTKSNEYARSILASPVTRRDNWSAYYAIYLPKMTFVLPTSHLSAKQFKQIEKRAVAATLVKGGFVSTFPHAVAYGPNRYGGIAMRPLKTEQVVEHAKLILKHLRCAGENHDMLNITLAWAQLATGMGFPLLEYPGRHVPHLECEWLQAIRTGLASINARVERVDASVFKIRRTNDCHIMDAICADGRYKNPQLDRINACRLYLKATLLSDISTACGHRIHSAYYDGEEVITHNWATVTYPRQARPNKISWALWRRALNQIHLRDDKSKLRQPLGDWLPPETYHHKWQWNYALDDIIHHDQDTNELRRHPYVESVRRQQRFLRDYYVLPHAPQEKFPIEPIHHPDHFSVPYNQIYPWPTPTLVPPPTTIQEMTAQLPDSLRHLVAHTEALATIYTAIHCLNLKQPIRLACDGGAFPGRASYGWILQIGDTKIFRGKGPAYGDDPRSFRAEGYGMASALLWLRLLQRQTGFVRDTTTTNILICDNQGLLTRIEEATKWTYTTPNVTLRPEWDIESVILHNYRELDIPFQFMHVYSHQDDHGPVASLSLESRLNVEADRLATEYLSSAEPRRPIALLFPSAKCQLIINNKSITRKIPQAIRYEQGSIEIRKYLRQRNTWTAQVLDEIDWDAHGSAHSHHRSQRCYLIKLCHRHLAVGKTLHRRNKKYSPTCPGCRINVETQHHYLQCQAPSRITWRLSLLGTLRQQLTALRTDTNLQELILHCIDCALAGRAVATTGPFSAALQSQARIGWLAMLRGYWSQEWQHAHDRTYLVPDDETRKERLQRQLFMGRWQNTIIQTTWSSTIQLWTLRNNERHGWDKESRDLARREVIHHELAEIYARKHQYPLRVQRLLRQSYDIHIQETVIKLGNWLDTYKGTFSVTWAPD